MASKKENDIRQQKSTTPYFPDPPGGRRVFRSLTLVDQISRALKDDILTGKLKGGDQLLEDSELTTSDLQEQTTAAGADHHHGNGFRH